MSYFPSFKLNMKTQTWLILVLSLIIAATGIYYLITIQPQFFFYVTAGWFLIVIGLLWVGTKQISKWLDKYFPWKKYVSTRFFVQLLLTIIYSLICLNGSYLLFKRVFTTTPPDWDQVIVMNTYGSLLILPIFSIYFGLHFLQAWKKSDVENEQFQKESVKSQLEALRNHLDPHFLFNNLNILSSLIDKDKELSKEYLEKFAGVYRIMLQNEVTELITLKKELEFTDSYLYLIKIRFQEGIEVDWDLDKKHHNKMIPPLCIQMLVENCIKHNAITESKPLTIRIYNEENDYIVVENHINLKKNQGNRKSSGLDNIKSRYSYFSTLPVVVEQTETIFKVKLPLLEIESI